MLLFHVSKSPIPKWPIPLCLIREFRAQQMLLFHVNKWPFPLCLIREWRAQQMLLFHITSNKEDSLFRLYIKPLCKRFCQNCLFRLRIKLLYERFYQNHLLQAMYILNLVLLRICQISTLHHGRHSKSSPLGGHGERKVLFICVWRYD